MKIALHILLWLAKKPARTVWQHRQHQQEIREYYLVGIFSGKRKPSEDFDTWRRERERRQRAYV